MNAESGAIYKILSSLLAWLLGFGAAAGLLHCILPSPALPDTVREKMAHWAAHGNDYEAVFLGSSRIQNHIIPHLFDSILSAGGVPMKSFNFGISALHTPEDGYLLDLLLAQPHNRLRWVFVEIDFFDLAVQKDQEGTQRDAYWHDWPRMCLLTHRLLDAKNESLSHRARRIRDDLPAYLGHAKLFSQRTVSMGRGAQLLRRALLHIPVEPMEAHALGEWQDGWSPAIPHPRGSASEHSAALRHTLEERTAQPPQKDESNYGSQVALAFMLKQITAAGATPILVVPPRVRQYYFYPERSLAAHQPMVNLCDPGRYPDLYREDLRIDGSHLNESGAEVFTRIMAGKFLAILESDGTW